MNLKYIFLVSIFTTICYCPFAQTCVLFLRTPDKIYVATDTRKAITNVIKKPNDHGIVKSHDTICKIYKIGNIYFSMAGYDPEEIIKYAAESCKKNSTILSTSLYFRNNFKKIAEAYVNKIRLLNYDFYLKNFYEFEYLQVLFYGFESDNPKMIEVDFKITTKENKPIKLKDSINKFFSTNLKNKNKDYAAIRGIGYTDEIKNLTDFQTWRDPNIESALYRLVKVECDSVPEHVSEPIDVLIIDKDGHTWVNNPNNCSLK